MPQASQLGQCSQIGIPGRHAVGLFSLDTRMWLMARPLVFVPQTEHTAVDMPGRPGRADCHLVDTNPAKSRKNCPQILRRGKDERSREVRIRQPSERLGTPQARSRVRKELKLLWGCYTGLKHAYQVLFNTDSDDGNLSRYQHCSPSQRQTWLGKNSN